MRQKTIYPVLAVLVTAFWIFGGALSAEETIELGTYYPSQKGKMTSVGVKESMILAPQSQSPTPSATDSPPGTLYYDASDLKARGIYFSDGVQSVWQSITGSPQTRFILRMTTAKDQILSNNTDPSLGTASYRLTPTYKVTFFKIPFWGLETCTGTSIITGCQQPSTPMVLYKDKYFKEFFAVQIDVSDIVPAYFTPRWGGSIGVRARTSDYTITVKLQGSTGGTSWRDIGTAGPYTDIASTRATDGFTYYTLTDDNGNTPLVEDDVSAYGPHYQYFRIAVYPSSKYEADVTAKVKAGQLWFTMTKASD